MVTQNIAVNGRSLINVQMKDENQQLEEVVIVGYGTQKKSSMTAAVSSVSAKGGAKAGNCQMWLQPYKGVPLG